jgi:hypothetical protein
MSSKINTLCEYVQAISDICGSWNDTPTTTHPWFRGQGDISWHLLPRLYREEEDPQYEREMFRDFKLRATAFLEFIPTHGLEWLFVMQHHGMPTRLLDWTESHLCALYFAVLDYQSAKDAAVWILDPWSLNEFSMSWQSVPSSTERSLSKYVLKSEEGVIIREVEAKKPIAVRPARSTRRIVAQMGTFTVHGKLRTSLDELEISGRTGKIRLARVLINGEKKKALLGELLLAGVSHSVMFPDLDGLSKEIHFRYSKQYLS